MIDDLYRTLFDFWQYFEVPKGITRDQEIEVISIPHLRKAMLITGFRRVGKTYLLYSLINKLLKNHAKSDLLYINLEDERITPKTEFLSGLIPAFKSYFGKNPLYLLLDELQTIPDWSRWLRRMLDTEKFQIFVTGSSSTISAGGLPTEMRGRSWETKVYPLSLAEYFKFKNAPLEDNEQFDFLFREYLLWGGLPEVVLSPMEKKIEILQGYFEMVVKKDIMDRFSVRKEELLKTILKLLLNSTYFSISKTFNQLKSLGYSLGKDTIIRYLSYAESSYFLETLPLYSPKIVNQLMYPRKLYFIDNGFITSLSTKFTQNYGRLFENWVYNQIKRKNDEVFYTKDKAGKEVDFAILKDGKVKTLYQACYDLSDFETREREIKNLISLGKKLNCTDLTLVTKKKIELATPKNIQILTPDNNI